MLSMIRIDVLYNFFLLYLQITLASDIEIGFNLVVLHTEIIIIMI